MSAILPNEWALAQVLHEARMQECYGNRMDAPSRRHWPGPEVTRHNYGHHRSPHVDIALAQARAALKWTMGDDPV